MKHSVSSLSELEQLAAHVAGSLPIDEMKATVVVLEGDLGAGKTTFVQMLAAQLGVETSVTSPTFGIMKRYDIPNDGFTSLIHMDAYRIEELDELRPLGFSELLHTPRTLICIEWGERIAAALPADTITMSFELQPDGSRTVTQATAEE